MKQNEPMRTCIVTREKMPKQSLIRLVRLGEEGDYTVEVDLRSKKKGRGANIKPEIEVLEKAFQIKAIERGLQLGRELTDQEKNELRQQFEAALEEKAFRPKNSRVRLKVSRAEYEQKLVN